MEIEPLTVEQIYDLMAEFFAYGLDQAHLEEKRKKLKERVEQACRMRGVQKVEVSGFVGVYRNGRKSTAWEKLARDHVKGQDLDQLAKAYEKVGAPYFEIQGPRKV